MKRGDFSAVRNRIYDPLTGQPFPNNVIPASRLSPQAQYFAASSRTRRGDQQLHLVPRSGPERGPDQLRLDHTLTEKHKVFVRYSFHDNRMEDPARRWARPTSLFPSCTGSISTPRPDIVAAVTSTLSSSFLNQFRFSYRPRSWTSSPSAWA